MKNRLLVLLFSTLMIGVASADDQEFKGNPDREGVLLYVRVHNPLIGEWDVYLEGVKIQELTFVRRTCIIKNLSDGKESKKWYEVGRNRLDGPDLWAINSWGRGSPYEYRIIDQDTIEVIDSEKTTIYRRKLLSEEEQRNLAEEASGLRDLGLFKTDGGYFTYGLLNNPLLGRWDLVSDRKKVGEITFEERLCHIPFGEGSLEQEYAIGRREIDSPDMFYITGNWHSLHSYRMLDEESIEVTVQDKRDPGPVYVYKRRQ